MKQSMMKKARGAGERVDVKLSLQDVVDLNWALYVARLNEVVTFQNAKARGDDLGCGFALDELRAISRGVEVVDDLFSQIMVIRSNLPEVEGIDED